MTFPQNILIFANLCNLIKTDDFPLPGPPATLHQLIFDKTFQNVSPGII